MVPQGQAALLCLCCNTPAGVATRSGVITRSAHVCGHSVDHLSAYGSDACFRNVVCLRATTMSTSLTVPEAGMLPEWLDVSYSKPSYMSGMVFRPKRHQMRSNGEAIIDCRTRGAAAQ
jgi:hypothetical protein